MAECIMVACDLHDATMMLKVAVDREAAVTRCVRHSRDARKQLIENLRGQARQVGARRVIFAYEASGLGFGLYDELTAAGIECHVLAPTKIVRSTQQKRIKTDEKDAEQILQLLRGHVLAGNALPDVWVPDLATRDDREVVRTRLDAAEKLAALRVQIRSLLKRSQLYRPEGIAKGWSRGFMAYLRCLPRDERIPLGTRTALASLLRQSEFLDEEIERLEKELGRLAESPRYAATIQELVKLRGVGLLTALVFLTEIGDVRRFANRRQISAYLGLVPRSYESGEASDRKGHITRQGPTRVRQVLCQATWARVRVEPRASELTSDQAAYRRIVAKNPKHKKIAVVAVMRRLAIQMWHRACEALEETPPNAPQPPHGRAARVA